MNYVDFRESEKSSWDRFVETSEDGWLYHTSKYIEWAEAEGARSLTFCMLTDSDEMLAICPLYVQTQTRYSHRAIYRFVQRTLTYFMRRIGLKGFWDLISLDTGFSGPAFSSSLGTKGRKKAWRELYKHVDQTARLLKADEVKIRMVETSPQNCPELRQTHDPLWQIGLYEHLRDIPRLSAFVDLRSDLKDILSDMDEDCRSEINKASKEGCESVCDPEDRIARYHSIHRESWSRTNGSFLPIEHFRGMDDFLGKSIHIFFARFEGKDIAAVMLHTFKKSAFYYGGCSLLQGQKVKANNFLLFASMRWAKENGYEWFGVGVFDSFPGLNMKEYKVGQYKAQFARACFPAFEGKKYYSKRAIILDAKDRIALIAAGKKRT